MLSFDDFEAEIPKEVDFRPHLVAPIRRYGRNHKAARDDFRGSDGYVYTQALKLVQDSRRPPKLPSDASDQALTDPEEHYRKKISALRDKTPNKRGSRRNAVAMLYWFFRAVDEPSYFREIAAFVWPIQSEMYKRFVYAKSGGNGHDNFSAISERFFKNIIDIKAAYPELWTDRHTNFSQGVLSRIGLDPDGTIEKEKNSPFLGIHFAQAGFEVPVHVYRKLGKGRRDESLYISVVQLSRGEFTIKRRRDRANKNEIPNLIFNAQTSIEAIKTINNSKIYYPYKDKKGSCDVIHFAPGTGMATSAHGSTQIMLTDKVVSFPSRDRLSPIVNAPLNFIVENKVQDIDSYNYSIDVFRIVDLKAGKNVIEDIDIIYFVFADFFNDPSLGKPGNINNSNAYLVDFMRVDYIIAIFE